MYMCLVLDLTTFVASTCRSGSAHNTHTPGLSRLICKLLLVIFVQRYNSDARELAHNIHKYKSVKWHAVLYLIYITQRRRWAFISRYRFCNIANCRMLFNFLQRLCVLCSIIITSHCICIPYKHTLLDTIALLFCPLWLYVFCHVCHSVGITA